MDIDYAMYTVNGAYTMGPEEATEMADFIGADLWNQHLVYIDDFLVAFA